MLPTGADTPQESSTTAAATSTTTSKQSASLAPTTPSRTLGEALGERKVSLDSPQETLAEFVMTFHLGSID